MISTAAGTGLAVTALVVTVPALGEPYASASLHVAVEASASLIALLAAYLVFGRFQQNARLGDLILFCALGIFGMTNALFRALPAALSDTVAVDGFALWAPVGGAVVGAFLLALAPLTDDVPSREGPLRMVMALLVVLASMTVVAAVASLRPEGGSGSTGSAVAGSARPEIFGDLALSSAHLVAALLFIVAAVGFTRRAAGDDLMTWLAAGATLAAFSRLNAGLFPSSSVGFVHLGDALRVGFYVLVLVGAAREIRRYWVKLAEAAVLEERRRFARDLHDGLAQELAYIVNETRREAQENPGQRAENLWIVAQRALDDSRRVIAALAEPLDQPLAAALASTTQEIAERMGVAVRLELEDGVEVDPDKREAVLRIVREAVANAARHADAHVISVRLSHKEGLQLEIADDGIGFDAAVAKRDRFGLISMKERAQSLGGDFRIHSQPGSGTRVHVVFP